MAPEIIEFGLYLRRNGYSVRSISTYCFVIHKTGRVLNYNTCSYSAVLGAISDSNYSLRYRQTIVAALKKYFHYLVEYSIRKDHPCARLIIRGNYDTRIIESDCLNQDELRTLQVREQRYSILDLRDKLLLSLLTVQGITAEEACRIKLQHILNDPGNITILRSRKLAGRKLRLLPHQTSLLHDYLQHARPKLERENTDYLLLGKTGQPITSDCIHYLVSTLQHKVPAKKLTPTLIRQSVIVWWINVLKLPIEQVQIMCGHRWLSTTEKYRFHNAAEEVRLVNRWL